MPLQHWSKNLFGDRIDFEGSLSLEEIHALIPDKDLKVLQCLRPADPETWKLLNDDFFTHRPDVILRVYGHIDQICDLAFVSEMSNVRHFAADSLFEAKNLAHIARLEKLESLRVGIYHLESFEFLNDVAPNLRRLFLGRTKSKKPDLTPLKRFTQLEDIYIEGHQKNIEVIAQLTNLEKVTLRSISSEDISYLKTLARMWYLDIKLGGIKSLAAVGGMNNIKSLELWQIRGLQDITVISRLQGLQYLFLQSLPRIATFPSLKPLKKLRRISLQNMRSLEDLSNLEFAPALEEFVHWYAGNMQPRQYLPLLRNPSLKRVAVEFGSHKKNTRFNDLLREYQIDPGQEIGGFNFI